MYLRNQIQQNVGMNTVERNLAGTVTTPLQQLVNRQRSELRAQVAHSVHGRNCFRAQDRSGHTGQMNHFWSTCNAECEGALIVRILMVSKMLLSNLSQEWQQVLVLMTLRHHGAQNG